MNKTTIGIENRISFSTLEQALLAMLDGKATSEYFHQLAETENVGKNRAVKTAKMLNRLTNRNLLLPYMMEHKEDVRRMLQRKEDQPLLYVALLSGAYTFAFDTISILGKNFHAQPLLTRDLLQRKLSEKYGSSRALYIGVGSMMPMLLDAGFVKRPRIGFYEMSRQQGYSEEARKLYQQSFMVNSTPSIENDVENNTYFEFIK